MSVSSSVSFLTYKLSSSGIAGDAQQALRWIRSGEKRKVVATINAHSTCVAQDDEGLRQALQRADLLIPDGISVVYASRFLKRHIPERVSGYDFFQTFCELADKEGGVSCFFLGSSEQVLAKIAARMAVDFPHVKVAGTLSPPFKAVFSEQDNADICAAINAARPDMLWVGMTAPKQEKWLDRNQARLDIGCAASIGAVFDFYANTKKRAPLFMRQAGLEWLHRLISEPKRVWRRYLINNFRFVWLVWQEGHRRA